MKIGSPLNTIPGATSRPDRTRYAAIYQAANEADGAWVPIECDNTVERNRIYNAIKTRRRQHRSETHEAKVRGMVIYVRRIKPVVIGVA